MATWFKWYDNTTNDPKFRTIARRSGQPLASVIGVWITLLERASEATDRGSIDGINYEVVDDSLDLEPGTTERVATAMEDLGMIQNNRVTKWDARQNPKSVTSNGAAKSNAERQRNFRERQKLKESNENITLHNGQVKQNNDSNGQVTTSNEGVTESNETVTLRNDSNGQVTTSNDLDKIREDKMRVKEQEANASSPEPSGEAPGTRQGESQEPVTEFTITLNSGEEYSVTQKDFALWQDLYPNVDIPQELRKMRGWCDANPSKRKTKTGVKRFITSWLAKEQDRPSTPRPMARPYQPQGQPSCPTEHQLHMQEQRLLKEKLLGMIHQKEDSSNQQTLTVTATPPQPPLLGGVARG